MPAGAGDRRQHVVVADVVAVGEMRGEQRLHHVVGAADSRAA